MYKLKKLSSEKFNSELNLFCENWNYKKIQALKKISNLTNHIPKTIDSYNLINKLLYEKKFLNSYKYKSKQILNLKSSLSYFIQNSKIPRNNRLKDRISMAFGLELRLPFLEHELIEYGLSLKDDFYFLNGKSKSILRETMKGTLNNKVRTSKKFSIQSPQNDWFKNKLFIDYFDEIINSDSFRSRSYYNLNNLKKLWNNFKKNKKNNTSFFLWQIINYEIWCRIFIDNNSLEKTHKFNY